MDQNFLTAQKTQQWMHSKPPQKGRSNSRRNGDLLVNKTAEKIIKADSKHRRGDSSKSPAQIDETLVQPIGIPKEKYIIGDKAKG